MSHFTDFTGYVLFIITSFLAGVESTDQCLLNSKVLSCFSGVIMSIRSFFLFEDYKTCLFNDFTEYRSQLMFRSSRHEVHTIEVNKVTLNRDDDKRISRKDGISTFARGHKDLIKLESLTWCAITYLE